MAHNPHGGHSRHHGAGLILFAVASLPGVPLALLLILALMFKG